MTMNRHTNLTAYALSQRNVLITDHLWRALRRLGHGVAGVWQSYRAARQRRDTIRHLNTLDDRMLRDIGIIRDQIPAAVDGLIATNTNRPRRSA